MAMKYGFLASKTHAPKKAYLPCILFCSFKYFANLLIKHACFAVFHYAAKLFTFFQYNNSRNIIHLKHFGKIVLALFGGIYAYGAYLIAFDSGCIGKGKKFRQNKLRIVAPGACKNQELNGIFLRF